MIKDFKIEDLTEISKLINRVSDKFVVAHYSETGQRNFKNFISPKAILERSKKDSFLLTFKTNNVLEGVIEVKDNNHICLFFVDPNHHRKGIGRKLMLEVFKRITGKTNSITVNSSEYAENVYRRFGFETVDVLQEINGIEFIPMRKTFY